jgi:hypothetical protein
MTRENQVQEAVPTGRSAEFYAPVDDEQDVQAAAQRVAQFILVGLERDEMDAVQVTMIEAKRESDR